MSLSTTEVRALSLLLERCLALPPPQREAWLAALPEPQQVLVPRLRQRLAELAPAALPAADAAAPAPVAPPPPRTHARHGERVGPYRLLQPLHDADPAAADDCWLAERAADTVAARQPAVARAPLALMLLPAGSARRTVATLPAHDHIVKLLDAGIDADGRGWRVLPAWPAAGLVEHARRRRLDALQRVALLLPVVDAVAGAHAAATAHGHLDAAAVRVDDEGRALVLDWGRGRRLDAASVAADLVGLGGLLHALLAEPLATGKAGPDLRAVLARTAPVAPQALRHAAVAELAADLRRVVDGEPVAGAAPWHRAVLALRRHRAGAAAGAVALLLLALGGVLAARQQAEGRARAQRSAQAEAFLVTARDADAGLSTAQQAQRTQQALEAARTGFAGDPLLRGRVLTGLALRFRELHQPDQALAVLGEAHALLERTAGSDPALPAVRAELAWELLQAGGADAPARAAALARDAVAGCGAGAECDAVRDRAQAVRDRLAPPR